MAQASSLADARLLSSLETVVWPVAGVLRAPGGRTAGLAATVLASTPPPRPRLPLPAFSSVNSLSEAASLLGPWQGLPGTAARRRAGGAPKHRASALPPGTLSSLEICAGAGGQALGLEQAGFAHEAVVELDADACETLRYNRDWKVIEGDVANVDGRAFSHVDLLAGGVPCPPFSIAGKQLGADDERDLFPQALRLVEEIAPRAVLLENVRGLGTRRFEGYRTQVLGRLRALGYDTWWDLVQASDHGVPQLRPRFVLVAMRPPWARWFRWPAPQAAPPPTVGEALGDLMAARGWPGAAAWARRATGIGPTIVGGSKKHGGPDLGPTRARAAWAELGVDGLGIADESPGPEFPAGKRPKLTVAMVARLQGFPRNWTITGRKTAAYRQVGNAFPPPVARALGTAIAAALNAASPAVPIAGCSLER